METCLQGINFATSKKYQSPRRLNAESLARFVFYKVMELQDTIFFIDDKIHCFWDKDPIETKL